MENSSTLNNRNLRLVKIKSFGGEKELTSEAGMSDVIQSQPKIHAPPFGKTNTKGIQGITFSDWLSGRSYLKVVSQLPSGLDAGFSVIHRLLFGYDCKAAVI